MSSRKRSLVAVWARGAAVVSVCLIVGWLCNVLFCLSAQMLGFKLRDGQTAPRQGFYTERQTPARWIVKVLNYRGGIEFWGMVKTPQALNDIANRPSTIYVPPSVRSILARANSNYTSVWTDGFPFRDRYGHYVEPEVENDRLQYGGEFSIGKHQLMVLYGPLWGGIILNMLVWGAWLPIAVFGWNRWIVLVRRRRGRCIACGYSLGELAAERCPECGAVCGKVLETEASP